MKEAIIPCITSSAYCLPTGIRGNHDPVFDWILKHNPEGEELFFGYKERRVLAPHEDLMTIMLPSAQKAIENSGTDVQEIDFLLGTASVSQYRNPNELSDLHRKLKLGNHCWPIPLDDAFSNFNSSLLFADALVRTGRARNVLICIGGNWTRNVSYHTPQAFSAADGAAAFMVGKSKQHGDTWVLKDSHTCTDSTYYGTMFTAGDTVNLDPPYQGHKTLLSKEYFHITNEGLSGFREFGVHAPPECTLELLRKNQLKSEDITLISHQASARLTEAWNNVIKPGQYIDTIAKFGNMALANVPVNLAWAIEHQPITRGHLVLLAIGPDMHANALLFSRTN